MSKINSTGKSLSEALIFASTNPQYDNRLSIEFPVQYMKIANSEHDVFTNCFVSTLRIINGSELAIFMH